MRLHRDSDGKLSAFAWPGGYPIFYVTQDNGALCPKCANGDNHSDAAEGDEIPADWRLVGSGINWEDPALYCDHCNARIESAYAEDEVNS